MEIDRRGNILINDPSQPVVFMLNGKGNLIQKIGKEGRGPGEFQNAGSFLTVHDSLAVTDGPSHKIEVFQYLNTKYEHIRTIDIENQKLLGNLLGLTDKGILLENDIWLSPFAPKNPTETAISFLDHKGDILQDTLFSVPIHEFVVHDNSETAFVRGKIFGNSSKLAYDDNKGRIYSLWTDKLSIDYFTLDGERHHAFSYPLLQPVNITKVERDSALNRLDEPTRDIMRKHMPDVKPIAGHMVVDDQQRLWVELLSEELGHGWFAFSADGEPLFHIKIPHHNAILQDIRGNTFLWNYTNKKGVPTAVKSRVNIPEV
ncbi:hypothetical protein Asal01_00694 [Fodinibius salicampi]|nr:6-bladed beta-propeller [Fodinibius salicampi]